MSNEATDSADLVEYPLEDYKLFKFFRQSSFVTNVRQYY